MSDVTFFSPYWREYYKIGYHQIWYLIIHERVLPLPRVKAGIPYYTLDELNLFATFNARYPRNSWVLPADKKCITYTPIQFRKSTIFGGDENELLFDC